MQNKNLSEDKIGKNLSDLDFIDYIYDIKSTIQKNIDTLYFIEIKDFCSLKDIQENKKRRQRSG